MTSPPWLTQCHSDMNDRLSAYTEEVLMAKKGKAKAVKVVGWGWVSDGQWVANVDGIPITMPTRADARRCREEGERVAKVAISYRLISLA